LLGYYRCEHAHEALHPRHADMLGLGGSPLGLCAAAAARSAACDANTLLERTRRSFPSFWSIWRLPIAAHFPPNHLLPYIPSGTSPE
jgi:hypothetical protein